MHVIMEKELPLGVQLCAPDYKGWPEGPCVFEAGPIQGTWRWQDEATRIIQESHPTVSIFCPRRPIGEGKKEKGDFNQSKYEEQVDWETHHLNLASSYGAILFWLAKETEHDCDRAFAQTSRFELAEWKMMHQHFGTLLVVGIEPGFTGERYIRHRLGQDCPNIPILNNLEETATLAASIALEKYKGLQEAAWASYSAP